VLDVSGDAARKTAQAGADIAHQATQGAGATMSTGLHYAGAAAAKSREEVAELEAKFDRLQGALQKQSAHAGASLLRGLGSLLPDDAEKWLDRQAKGMEQDGEAAYRRNLDEAAQARHAGQADAAEIRETTRIVEMAPVRVTARLSDYQHDVIAGAGARADQVVDAAAAAAHIQTSRMPAQGALVGGALASSVAVSAQYSPLDPFDYPNLSNVAKFASQIVPSTKESVERHLLTEVVEPSLEHKVQDQEERARKSLQGKRPAADFAKRSQQAQCSGRARRGRSRIQ